MAKKTLNQANLETLGAENLAALVMELVLGSAPLQRRARMELSPAQGAKDVVADLRKRFASLRRATGFVDWRKRARRRCRRSRRSPRLAAHARAALSPVCNSVSETR